MLEMFVGRMGMSMKDFFESDLIELFTAWNGHLKQKRQDLEALRVMICEQTMNLMNISGKMLKRELQLADFGIGERPQMTEEQFRAKVDHANQIKWVVGNKEKEN